MTATNNIYSFSNFTLPGAYTHKPGLHFSPSTTSKKYSSSKIDFSITIPAHIALKSFNPPEIKKNIPEKKALHGPSVLNGAYVVADYSTHIRQGFLNYQRVYGTQNPAASAALGFTTWFNIVSGGLNVKNAIKEFKTAKKVSDIAGKNLSLLKIGRGAAQIAAGSVSLPARVLAMASLISPSSGFSAIANILGTIGSSCFRIVSIMGGIGISIRLHEQRLFRNELDLILKDPNFTEQERAVKALEHLKRLASISPQEKEEIRKEISLQPEFSSLNPQQITEKVEQKANTLLMKKEAYLKRLTSEDCLTQIRQNGPADAKTVIEAVQKRSKEKIILAAFGMGLIALGLTTMLVSFVCTGPVGIILTASLSLATPIGWILLNSYGLYNEFKSIDPGRFEKLWIFISTVVAVTAMTSVFFLSGGTAPIIVAVAVEAVWFGINFYCYYRLHQLEQKKQLHLIKA